MASTYRGIREIIFSYYTYANSSLLSLYEDKDALVHHSYPIGIYTTLHFPDQKVAHEYGSILTVYFSY